MKLKNIILILCIFILFDNCQKKTVIKNYSYETHEGFNTIGYKYIIFRDLNGYDPSTVLYYFHGLGGNEYSWMTSNTEIINEWRKSGKKPPVVVSISLGEEWLLFFKNNNRQCSGYLELVNETIIPQAETFLGTDIKKRMIMGFSMGGLNAAQLVFRYPEKFRKAVIIAPFIYTASPFSNYRIIDEMIQNTESIMKMSRKQRIKRIFKRSITGKVTYINIYVLKYKYISDKNDWEKNNILTNIKKPEKGNKPEIYISCGTSDENGFYPGSELLAQKAADSGYLVTWKPHKGTHMVINEKEVAAFLL